LLFWENRGVIGDWQGAIIYILKLGKWRLWFQFRLRLNRVLVFMRKRRGAIKVHDKSEMLPLYMTALCFLARRYFSFINFLLLLCCWGFFGGRSFGKCYDFFYFGGSLNSQEYYDSQYLDGLYHLKYSKHLWLGQFLRHFSEKLNFF
jgi:hypothetical protein